MRAGRRRLRDCKAQIGVIGLEIIRSCAHIGKGLIRFNQTGRFAAECLPAMENHVYIPGIEFDEPRTAPRCAQRRSRFVPLPSERVRGMGPPRFEQSPDRISDKSYRLHSRMHGQFGIAVAAKRVDPRVVPDIRAIAATLAEPKVVDVCGRADLEDVISAHG